MSEDEIFQAWVEAIRQAERNAASDVRPVTNRCERQEAKDEALYFKLKELARDMRHACRDAYADAAGDDYKALCGNRIMNATLTPPREK